MIVPGQDRPAGGANHDPPESEAEAPSRTCTPSQADPARPGPGPPHRDSRRAGVTVTGGTHPRRGAGGSLSGRLPAPGFNLTQ